MKHLSLALLLLSDLKPIDIHTHVYKADPTLARLLIDLNLHMLDILVIDDRDAFFKQLQPQLTDARAVAHTYPGRINLCTTFSPYNFQQPDFAQRAIQQLDSDFNQGAVAVKIYKTIGLEIKTKSGKYLLPDDPVFDPIYQAIAARNKTVVAHLAEPDSCWQPPNPKSPDFSYYTSHPEEYAYLHPDWPAKETILKARDHVLEKHPALRMVGAHLGSMEVNVDQIAARLDRYPNFAVDTAARVQYLMLQPRDKVRDFLIKYQDRVLYGTDFDLEPRQDAAAAIKNLRELYQRDWNYFSSLDLPTGVLQKLYHNNATHWFPGLHLLLSYLGNNTRKVVRPGFDSTRIFPL